MEVEVEVTPRSFGIICTLLMLDFGEPLVFFLGLSFSEPVVRLTLPCVCASIDIARLPLPQTAAY